MTKPSYHHGNLHQALLTTATTMLNQHGIDSLSLRKIAEQVGVSRTAAYHHFSDKHALLCAIASHGFTLWQETAEQVLNKNQEMKQQLHDYFNAYLKFATENQHIYGLMFGRTVWLDGKATQTLTDTAYPTFNFQVAMIKQWQASGLFDTAYDPLRVSQVIWGMLHGIATLKIDGIYTESSSIEQICQCAVELFSQQSTP